jgi:hypothetical protein
LGTIKYGKYVGRLREYQLYGVTLRLSIDCPEDICIAEIKSIFLFVLCGGIIAWSHITQPFDASNRLLH